MTLTVDDLVSSLSNSCNISQEAIDIATLQAQLAQTLFNLSTAPSRQSNPNEYAQPCNTPTTRTPTSSISWGHLMDVLPRKAEEPDVDMEDERIVEGILIPNSNSNATPLFNHQATQAVVQQPPQQHGHSYTNLDNLLTAFPRS